MNLSDINDKLLLIYENGTDKPLGTGFLINDFGHFITSYHVVKYCVSIKDNVRCELKGKSYRVRYVQSLVDNGFYTALKESRFTIDLIILELSIPERNYGVEHLPTLLFDVNAQFHKPIEVSLSGFNCEKFKEREKAELSSATITLTEYNKENGLWLFVSKDEIWQGYSGSPILHPQLGEVMGVVVRRSLENKQIGAIQSLHMLSNELKSYGYDSERFFRSPFSLYYRYYKGKCHSFESENWPYAIDVKEFVDAFDFKTGCFPLKEQWGLVKSNKCIVPFIIEQLKEHPVFCCGYYGMGKTTISKFLFSKYFSYSEQEYPVYISLADARLSTVNSQNWYDFVVGKVYQDFLGPVAQKANVQISDEFMRHYIRHFLNYNRVTLILDGIDEALWDKASLREFASVLKSLPCPYFLTSRMEFYAFFDEVGDRMDKCPHLVIELLSWGETQWRKYIGQLHEKYAEKSDSIERLGKALEIGEYGTLPERPLFLKMISDIELDDEARMEEELPQQLRKNRAAVYHAYIRWKVKDDFVRKGIKILDEYNKDDFADEAFRLFQGLANVEYSKSVPTEGAIGYLKSDAEYGDMYAVSAFNLKDIGEVASQLDLFDPKFVKRNVLGSTFFSILSRERKRLFRFSHKSFCEYLIGYNLASSIFTETVDEAECGRAWDFYQTHEVSAHFQDEIGRIVKVWDIKKIEKEDKKLYLQKAFEKVLLEKHNLRDYSERFEEVLYYTGRLETESPEILRLLKKITAHPEKVHPVYYRTAHLSLSMCENVKWCEKYIKYLIGDFHGEKKAFQLNSDIQINYYGKGNIRSVLKKDIEKFITGDNLLGILPLKIFSYFVCLPFDAADVNSAREYLSLIEETCEKRGHTRMVKIMNETLHILENVNRSN